MRRFAGYRKFLVTAFLLFTSACAWPQAAQVKPIRVGLIAPLTGNSAGFGISMRKGAEVAQREINEAGGYLGRPIEFVVRDDKSNADEGRKAALDLVVQQKVDFTLGFCNSGVALKALDVFQSHRHLLMVPCTTGTSVTTTYPPAESFIFRVGANDLLNAKFLVHEVVQRRRLRKVAVFAEKTAYGDGGVKDIAAELAAHGLQPVYVGRFAVGLPSLAAELRDARAAGAEAIVAWVGWPEHGTLAASRAELGWKVPYFAPWALGFRGVIERAGADALEGTMMVQSIIQDTANERRTSFLLRYYRHHGERQIGALMAAAQAYDAMHLMVRALFQTRGDTSGLALKRALENFDRAYHGVVTTYADPFNSSDHDAYSLNMLWLGVWRKGEIGFFYPEEGRLSGMVRRKEPTVNALSAAAAAAVERARQ